MSMTGFLNDLRCSDALDTLELKKLPGGRFPAEGRFYQMTQPDKSSFSLVNWGGVSKNQMNPWSQLMH